MKSGHSKTPVAAGQRFGRLTTVCDVGRSSDGHRTWKCVCDCGNECVRQTNNLRTKSLASCGCANRDLHIIHGMKSSKTYISWQAAKRRCHAESDKDFHRYGAKGIQMCDEWRDSFEAFYSHMGEKPTGMSLDRFPDINGNYEPGNCRWATFSDQNKNRKVSVHIEWRGKKQHLSVVASDLGITYGAAFMRLKRGKLHDFL